MMKTTHYSSYIICLHELVSPQTFQPSTFTGRAIQEQQRLEQQVRTKDNHFYLSSFKFL